MFMHEQQSVLRHLVKSLWYMYRTMCFPRLEGGKGQTVASCECGTWPQWPLVRDSLSSLSHAVGTQSVLHPQLSWARYVTGCLLIGLEGS